MAAYKYDPSTISNDIAKLNNLANSPVIEPVVCDTQNKGDVIQKVLDFVPQLNELHRVIIALIAATATATQTTLNQMIQLDDEFVEIEENKTTS